MKSRHHIARALACIAAFLWMGFFVPGCNTTEGAGEDIEELGDSIEDAAD